MNFGDEMNEANNSQVCERTEDLVSFLYGELGEREARSFEQHRRNCRTCDAELKAFGPVRQSILTWRDQSLGLTALNSIASNAIQALVPEKNRSALAAIRGFFALAPMWMKGATAVATVLFCVLAGLAVARLLENPRPQVSLTSSGFDSEAETERRINEEVKRRVEDRMAALSPKRDDSVAAKPEQPRERRIVAERQRDLPILAAQKMRKPLTRAEREQLAADLRLVLDEYEDSLELLGDRINR
jgi:hypothetical protein